MSTGSHNYLPISLDNMGKNLLKIFNEFMNEIVKNGKATAKYKDGDDTISVIFKLGGCGKKVFIHKTIKRVGTLSPTEKFFELSLA